MGVATRSGYLARPSRKNVGSRSGCHKNRKHRSRNRRDPLTEPDGSTNLWRRAKTRDQSRGGLYSYSHGSPRRWTSMRDTCGTSSSDRSSLVDIPPQQSYRTTCSNYTACNSRHQTCGRASQPAKCLRKWEMRVPLYHAVWRSVRAKDRCSKFKAQGWGSLAAIWTMAQAAESDEDLLVCTSAILATTYGLRISECASIRV